MNLFVYEYVSGGGTWHSAGTIDPTGSLLAEGTAMATAVISDCMAAGHAVTAMLDARLRGNCRLPCPVELITNAAGETVIFDRMASQADATLLIAPEIGGTLLDRCRRVEGLGGKLLSPDARFVAIAADKQITVERLHGCGVPVPLGMRLECEADAVPPSLFPAVVKPCDGAGSWHVSRVDDAAALRRQLACPTLRQALADGNLRLERFVPGMAASVAVLCGRGEQFPLEPCEQILAGGFEYRGGRLPLAEPVAIRARKLALQAIQALPPTCGYVGVDLILGSEADGSGDFVIEVNPRLTTSYVGLRVACRQNLASAMLAAALGRPAAVSFGKQPVEFSSDGKVRPARLSTT